MRPRLLLDPTAESGGGGTPPPAPAQAQAPAQPPAQHPSPAPAGTPPTSPVATVPISELQQYLRDQHRLAELEAQRQQEHDAAEQARLAEMAKRGEAERALAEQKKLMDSKVEEWQRRYNELSGRLHGERKTAVVADALTGVDFISPEAGRQARLLLDAELETATDAEGRIVVRQKGTGRPAADYIKDMIASQGYSHFLKPTSTGGGGAGGGSRSAPSPAPERAQTPAERQKAALQAALGRASGGAPGLNGLYGRPVTVNN